MAFATRTHDQSFGLTIRTPARAIFASRIFLWFAYCAVTLTGLGLRFLTMGHYLGNIDEPASLLAIHRTAETGYPIFPSGVLYLQGAVLSYIAAPLSWFYASDALLDATRYVNLALAVLIIPLSMKLSHYLTNSVLIAILVGLLVATDPNLIIWGITIRPYGLLTVEFMALVLLFSMLIKNGPHARIARRKVIWWIPLVATIGTFTHVGIWLAFPALAVAAVAIWGRSLLHENRAIPISGFLSLLPLVVFFLLGSFVGIGSGTTGNESGEAFVGSHLFNLPHMLKHPSVRLDLWTDNFKEGSLHQYMPFIIAIASLALIRNLLNEDGSFRNDRQASITILAVLFVHWMTILVVAVFVTTDFEPRYLTQVLPLGYVIVGLAVWSRRGFEPSCSIPKVGIRMTGLIVVALLIVIVRNVSATEWRIDYKGGSPDYWTATEWVAGNWQEGDIVITAQPPSAYFWFDEDQLDHSYFLAGPEASERTARYIKKLENGSQGDYWLGLPPIASTSQLCAVLHEHAGSSWFIVDKGKLYASWAFQGPMQQIVIGSSTEQYRAANGAIVYRVKPDDGWSERSNKQCSKTS